MADSLADLWEEATGTVDTIGFLELNTIPVGSSESGTSVSFANSPGSPLDIDGNLGAPDESQPLNDDEWSLMMLGIAAADVTMGNAGKNRFGTLPSGECFLYETDFYNRIHLSPTQFSLGNVLSDTTVQFQVWNAFFIEESLMVIDETGTTSLTLNEPTPPGPATATYPALAEFQYTIDVDDVGPAEISAEYLFRFSEDIDAKCLDFSTGETLSGALATTWGISDSWTISFWYKPTSTTDNTIFTVDPPSGSFNSIQFGYEFSTLSYRVRIVDQGFAGDIKVRDYPTEVPDLGEWVHFTIIKAASGPEADALRLYRNGQIVSWVVIGADDHVDQLDSIRTLELFGSSTISATGQGRMHSWALWPVELLDSEIAAIYNFGEGRTADLRVASGAYNTTSLLRRFYRLGKEGEPDLGRDLGNLPRDLSVSVGITDADVFEDAPANVAGIGWPSASASLPVTGSRISLFPHCPQRGYTEGLMWKTNIIEAWDGAEQRIRVRKLPRQKFQIEYLIDEQIERTSAQNALVGNIGRSYGVPLFHFSRPLDADATIGQNAVFVTTANADFRESTAESVGLAVLWRAYDDFEVVTIAIGGVNPTTIGFTQPLIKNHDAATTIIMPIQVSLLNDGAGWQTYQSGSLQRFNCEWLAEEVTDLADLSGLQTHDGTVVFDDPNFMSGDTLDESLKGKFEVFDSGSGAFVSLPRRLSPEVTLTKGFETLNEADSFVLRQRIYGLLGRQKTFYIPSFRNDFNLVTAIGAADVNLDVTPTGYARFNEDTLEPFGDVMIERTNGARFFRKIVGVTVGVGLPDREELEINTSLGEIIPIADVKRISYLYKVRLNSDTVEILHLDRGVYSVRIPLAGVRV